MALSDDDKQLLALERHWWRYAGQKATAIRRELGISPTTYRRRLARLVDDPDALEWDRMLVVRLRRMRRRAG